MFNNDDMKLLSCAVCGTVRGHWQCHQYHTHEDGEKYARNTYTFCVICGTVNYDSYNDLVFIVPVGDDKHYFLSEFPAVEYAKLKKAKVIAAPLEG